MSVYKFTNMSRYAISTSMFEQATIQPKSSLVVELPANSKPQTIIDLRAKQGEYSDQSNFVEILRILTNILERDYGEGFLQRVKVRVEDPAPPQSIDLIDFQTFMKVGDVQTVKVDAKNLVGKIMLGTKDKGLIKISGMTITAEEPGKVNLVYGTKDFNRTVLLEIKE